MISRIQKTRFGVGFSYVGVSAKFWLLSCAVVSDSRIHSTRLSLAGRSICAPGGLFTVLLFSFLIANSSTYAQSPSADDYVKLAEDHKRNARPDSAIHYYDLAATSFQSNNETASLVNAYNQIGIILTRQDKYPEAMDYLNRALQLGLSSLDSNHAFVATTYLSMGVVLNAEEKYEEAIAHHLKALSIRLKLNGENHADVATSYGNLGNVYLYNNQPDKSIEAHTKAMHIRLKVFGPDSPEIVESFRGLGNAYRELKEYEQSLAWFEKALKNKILQYGEGAKELSKFYGYVSDSYYLLNKTEKGDYYKLKAEEVKNVK